MNAENYEMPGRDLIRTRVAIEAIQSVEEDPRTLSESFPENVQRELIAVSQADIGQSFDGVIALFIREVKLQCIERVKEAAGGE